MGTHSQSWSGLNLVIYGCTPLVPMQIEQSIATVAPANEVIIDSFEHYDDAFDFCKKKQNVGFIFLLENCGSSFPLDIFKQLASPFESKGWPVFGVLLYEETESLTGLRTIARCPQLIDYIPIKKILNTENCAEQLNQIWEKFILAFEKKLIPTSLQETFYQLAEPILDQVSKRFIDRISTLLNSSLNISWLDTIAIRWAPIFSALMTSCPAAIRANPMLRQICDTINISTEIESIEDIAISKKNLSSRICSTAILLNKFRIKKILDQELTKTKNFASPGNTALLRNIAKNSKKILEIANDEENSSISLRGVVNG